MPPKAVTVEYEFSCNYEADEAISNITPAIASNSLGDPRFHRLQDRLRLAAESGFKGIELYYPDIEMFAGYTYNGNIFRAAQTIHELCSSLGLTIVCLQPLFIYEGLLLPYKNYYNPILFQQTLPEWIKIARTLGTNMILVPANDFGPSGSGGAIRTWRHWTNLRTLADEANRLLRETLENERRMGRENWLHPIGDTMKIAYKPLAWSDHVNDWSLAMHVVRAVRRPNFGLCLDTFTIAANVYADPNEFQRGLQPNAEVNLHRNVTELVNMFVRMWTETRHKLFLVQVSDAEKLDGPIPQDLVRLNSIWAGYDIPRALRTQPYAREHYPTVTSWWRNYRLFPFEQDRGGYLPINEIFVAILRYIGYRGWVSFDMTSRTLEGQAPDIPPDIPRLHAERARESLENLLENRNNFTWTSEDEEEEEDDDEEDEEEDDEEDNH